jgi:hypothetical protein
MSNRNTAIWVGIFNLTPLPLGMSSRYHACTAQETLLAQCLTTHRARSERALKPLEST